jgi:hypothetical protein
MPVLLSAANVCHADVAADLAAAVLSAATARLEELNEKRQSMVSKLKGAEKELTGGCSNVCTSCRQQLLLPAVLRVASGPTEHGWHLSGEPCAVNRVEGKQRLQAVALLLPSCSIA